MILIIRTNAALTRLGKPRTILGAEQKIVAGPVGDSLLSEEECKRVEDAEIWSYIKSKGLSGGIQIDGNIMIER